LVVSTDQRIITIAESHRGQGIELMRKAWRLA
jgi:hypothetical protein